VSERAGSEPALTVADVDALRECIAGGGVCVFGADTVYGLGCDPENELAVRRLYELKGYSPARAAMRPAAVMFFALSNALRELSDDLGPRERAALEALLPGPLTLLLGNRSRRYPLACGAVAAAGEGEEADGSPGADGSDTIGSDTLGFDTLGLRVPWLGDRLAALSSLERPLLQSSANLSGGPEARRLPDIPASIRAGADLVLDGGELPGVASTVLDLRDYARTGQWRIVRAGPLGRREIERMLISC
jgi:L-threonylcarbamoyladenylate synthase